MEEKSIHGYREDLKKSFKSSMEANIARYYCYLKIPWEYESKEFEFKKIKRGNRYYKPDFYLPIAGIWTEAKGWFRKNDKVKLRRFKKFFPEEFAKLWIIIPDKFAKSKSNGESMNFLLDDLGIKFSKIMSYKEMEKLGEIFIPNWE